MDYFQAFWLAVIQGITEFLPVSSSGHLALVPSIFGWSDQGLAFDVAVHVGTLLAVLIYFRQDISLILRDWIRSIFTGISTIHSKLAWAIAFASVLIGMVGVLLETFVSTVARNPISIAYATLLFGVLFFLVAHSMESSFLPLEMVYEHRNYLPSVGLSFAAAFFIARCAQRFSQLRLGVLSGATMGVRIDLRKASNSPRT